MTNPIVFSTLACPQWPVATVIAKAVEYGYTGLEWRGGPQGHINPSATERERSLLRESMAELNLTSVAVTAYTSFVSPDAGERAANVYELNRYVDLAADMGARYVRVFLGELPVGQRPTATVYNNILECLEVALQYADRHGVSLAIEPHDNFAQTRTVLPILERINHPALTVIWDIANGYAAGEEVETSFKTVRDRLAYVQVKDGLGRGPTWQLCQVGAGQVPLAQAFQLLTDSHYAGAFSVEWEAAWHPELDPPEVALPAALRFIKRLVTTHSAAD